MATCTTRAQTCCVSENNGQIVTSCESSLTCPDPSGTALHCESAADCPGPSVCCLATQNSRAVSECRQTCGGGDVQLCDPTAPDPGCPLGRQCQPPNGGAPPLPNGVDICGG
jgi:hypothetical protein